MAKGSRTRDGIFRRNRIWWIRTDPITGKPETTRCTDFEAACRFRAARERLAADPAHAAAATARLGTWIQSVIEAKREAGKSAATLEVYEQKLGHYARLWGADCALSSIVPTLVDEYVATRRKEGASAHTISKEHAHLATVLRAAKRAGCFPGDVDTLKPAELAPGYVPRKRALSSSELRALLAELPERRGAFVAAAVALGTRLSETFRLGPEHYDAKAGTVVIPGTKTAESARTVPVLSPFRALLEAAIPLLPLQAWPNLGRDLKRACDRAKIPHCTPNDLRRTHATLLAEFGVDKDVVRRLLGHTSTAMFDRVYGRPSPEALRELAEARISDRTLHGRYNDTSPIANPGASSEVRTPDLRFTKPDSGSDIEARASDYDNLARASAHGSAGASATDATRTLQRGHSVGAWALAFAAARMGVLPGQEVRS